MYIDRPMHQKELKRAVEGSMHAVLSGESGGGKSWLYRYVSGSEGWKTFYANAGNAARYNSITATIQAAISGDGDKELTEYTQTLGGEVGALGFGGAIEATRTYAVRPKEVLLDAFKIAREKAEDAAAVVVIDNLEAIFQKPNLMEELGNIILLLDDPDYARYRVKILMIGVPAEIVEYYQRIPNLETVANRIVETPLVTGMNWGQIEDFIRRGFVAQLKVGLTAEQVHEIAKHVELVTLGIAQRLHEYSEILAYNIHDSAWQYDRGLLDNADEKFLKSCLKKSYAVVDSFMNERKTKNGRRNQVLFALGKISLSEFDVYMVEELVRQEFPESTNETSLAISQMMAELASGDSPLLRRASKGNYRFADPRYLMCIRVMLGKSSDECVFKRTWRR